MMMMKTPTMISCHAWALLRSPPSLKTDFIATNETRAYHKREILFFSKMMSGMWPHAGALGERITEYAAEPAVNPHDPVSSLQIMKDKYYTKGVTARGRASPRPAPE